MENQPGMQNAEQGLSIYELDADALAHVLDVFEEALLCEEWETGSVELGEQQCEAMGFTFASSSVWVEGGEMALVRAKGCFGFTADANETALAQAGTHISLLYAELYAFKRQGWEIYCDFEINRYGLVTAPAISVPGTLSVAKVKTRQHLLVLVRQFVAAVFDWLRELLRAEFWARLDVGRMMEELEHRHVRFNAQGEEI